MSDHELTTNIKIEINGTAIPMEAKGVVLEVVVDQHVHLPNMFTIRLVDVGLELLNGSIFDPGKEVKISADNEGARREFVLMEGEITALEPSFGDDMLAELVVRGYDKTHRLFRETKSQAFLNQKDSDLAQQIAGNVGLSPQVDATSTVYDHIFQDNRSDLAFLMHRAWRIGYECFVEDSKLYFRKPPTGGDSVDLVWGQDLRTFYPRMTLAEQVDEVVVRGWDEVAQSAIVGRAAASSAELWPQIRQSQNGAQLSSGFGTGKMIVVDQPVVNQSEADVLAKARLNELSGAFVQAEGEAYRRPDIRAGKMVNIDGLGDKFSGKYLVTEARHIFTEDGLQTTFSVRGARSGSMAEQVMPDELAQRWSGAVTAVVTNADDPDNYGRVKVKFPWMTDDAESWWARVVSAGAGPEAGLYAIPDVGDEVLVVFEHGDFNRPFVLGGLWNGQAALPPAAGSGGEQPQTRIWQSRKGHKISIFDNADDKIEIETAGGHILSISDADSKILIKSSGGAEFVFDDNGSKISMKSTGDLQVEAQSNVNIKATASMTLEANANMTIKANGNMDIQANGMTNIKGATVNLN